MKISIVLILVSSFLFSAKSIHHIWEKGKTFSQYLRSHNISLDLLESISKDDHKYLSEIESGHIFYELKNKNDELLQALIPINQEMQIHLAKDSSEYEYSFDIIPIKYKKKEYYAKVIISSSLYEDTLKITGEKMLADRISLAMKGVVDVKNLRKGDEIAFTYKQKTRLGRPYYMPDISVIRVKMNKKDQFIYVDEDGHGYINIKSKQKEAYTVSSFKKVTYTRRVPLSRKSSKFVMPLRHIRITSKFSYSRWHPILKRYRPHHGTDFGARRGTPLLAVNAGTISFSGRMGGYGKVVKIKHSEGYESLYAHQSRIRVKKGQKVKKGQIIGYVGSTGRSTGPHLHFGLKKKGKWIDPMKVLKKKSILLSEKTVLKEFTKYKEVQKTKYRDITVEDTRMNKIRLLQYKINKIRLLRYIQVGEASFVWNKEKNKDRQ